MAIFSVLNGSGLNGAGIQFGSLNQIAASGGSTFPAFTPTTGTFVFNDAGVLTITGTGMVFQPLISISGTVDSLTYTKVAPVFSITGFSVPLVNVFGLITGGDAVLAAIFSGNDTIGGSTQADRLYGFDGADAITGLDGNDTLRGGAGADVLDGGAGSDFANYQGSAAAVVIDLLNHSASGGDAAGDTLTSIENLYGSSNDDQLSGDDARNVIGGENGADTLTGNGGDDAMNGEVGDDQVNGGEGNDRLVGGAGVDTIQGGDGNDSIDAGSENDLVFGEAGNDNIYGGTGDDQLSGGDGSDALDGAAGDDTINGGGDTDLLLGGDGNDTLRGGDANDRLIGGTGDDALTGGGGSDLLQGGAGNDTFTYQVVGDSTVAAAGKDVIADFTTGDRIDLSAIDANGAAAGNGTFIFGTGAFTGVAGELRVLAVGGVQLVYADTNGDRQLDFAINVISDHALTAADFVL